jgi:hypothetical protein
MFSKQNLSVYVIGIGLVMFASYVGNMYRQTFQDDYRNKEYDMIKQYLLNDSPLYGNNRPKMWIHSMYEVNARKWRNFMSRNTTGLNQPYLYLTIESIIRHCADDFHICLIDDDSFEKLLPSWDVDLKTIPEPMRSRYRDMAMVQLLQLYGGMIVPNSFLCTKSLFPLYEKGVSNKTPFMFEKRTSSFEDPTKSFHLFEPDVNMMGSKKEDPFLQEMLNYMTSIETKGGHFSQESGFKGELQKWCSQNVHLQNLQLVDGAFIGIKNNIGKPVLLDELMEDGYLEYDMTRFHGIYIPAEELLRRPKYQWFTILPIQEVLETNAILIKYIKMSLVDVDDHYKKNMGDQCSMAVF